MLTVKGVIVRTHLLLAVAISITACNRTSPSSASSSEVPIEQVLANPQAYAHRLVTIRGCYFSGFESSLPQPCQDAHRKDAIWVEDAAMIHSIDQLQPPGIRLPERQELRTPSKSVLVFQYEDATNRAAWNKLLPEASQPIYWLQVAVVGQFETIAPQEPGPMRSGFGHMGAFGHELILVDVLSSRMVKSGQ